VITGGMDDLPVLIVSAASDDDLQDFSKKVEDVLVPALKSVEGARDVSVAGEREREISVTLDEKKARDKGVDPSTVATLFMADGTAIPAGTLRSDSGDFDVQVGTTFASVKEVKNLRIQTADDPVKLGDVATVEEVDAPQTGVSRVNGRPSLTLSITKTLSGNTVAVADALRAKLESLKPQLGTNVDFEVIFDQSPFITDSIRDLTTEGLIGLVMAIVVIMVFLWAVGPTLITAISIPLSLLIALIGLYVGGDSLNILTLGALTVAIGRVVDDSIVIIENIKRHQSMGHVGRPATVAAVKEVAGAVTSSTLTTVAVFLPIGLVGGQVGQLFRPFAVTVTIALLASLVVAMTVVPVLASWFMRVKGLKLEPSGEAAEAGGDAATGEERSADDAPATAQAASVADGQSEADGAQEVSEVKAGQAASQAGRAATAQRAVDPAGEVEQSPSQTWLRRAYEPVLNWALGHRWITLAVAFAVLVGTLALAPNLKTDFIGDMGQNLVQVTMKLPSGSGQEQADQAAAKVEALLAKESGVKAYQTTVGGTSSMMGMMTGSNGGGSSTAIIYVTLKDGADDDALVARLRSQTADMEGLGRVQIASMAASGTSSQAVVYVESSDPDQLKAGASAVAAALEKVPGLTNVNSDTDQEQTMLRVDLNAKVAAEKGYTKATVGQAIARSVRGQLLGTIAQGDETMDVYLHSGQTVTTLDELRKTLLPVTTQMTAKARLDAADKISEKSDKLADEQQAKADALTAEAKATATKAYNKQVKALKSAQASAKKSIAKLNKTLASLKKKAKSQQKKLNSLQAQLKKAMAVPASQTNPNVTSLVYGLTQKVSAQAQAVVAVNTAIAQTTAGIAQANSGVASAKSSLTALKDQRNTSLDSQAKQEALTDEAKAAQEALADEAEDAQKLKADPVSVDAVATVEEVAAPASITRVDGARAATVTASVEASDLGRVNTLLEDALDGLDLPEGVTWRIGGVSQQQADAFNQLYLAMLVAIGVVYLVMVATFGSLLQPLILLVSIPFAATGALGLSLATDTAIGVPSMIGMLMLIGIVVTNAIVLIDLINQYRKSGEDVDTSVRHGALLRVRPIVMTALATIFALLPMGLGLTGGSVFISRPLAIVVMGGLVSSTLLTLIIVPVVYDLLEKWRERRRQRRDAVSQGVLPDPVD
ncbi:MAG: efflux RND transporter permease subunit, partial [Propionibacteriaceae bacterium]|nr:efflux RND transporter permease subunit [Propionibacteriaceae bacterium]